MHCTEDAERFVCIIDMQCKRAIVLGYSEASGEPSLVKAHHVTGTERKYFGKVVLAADSYALVEVARMR